MNQLSKTNKKRLVFFIGSLILFFILTWLVVEGSTKSFDLSLSTFIYGLRIGGLTTLLEAITYLGNWEAITSLCLLLLIYPKTRFEYGIPVSAAALITLGIKALVKPLVERPRPDIEFHWIEQGGFSFPSGHAITSMAVFVMLFILIRRHMKDRKKKNILSLVCIFLSIFIGFSRVYLGVHYPTDVIGGWLAALAVIFLILITIDIIKEKRTNK